MATSLKSAAVPRPVPPEEEELASDSRFHWSMRLMSAVSLLTLAFYTYVLRLCHQMRQETALNEKIERRRVRMAVLAFGLDLLISAYFGAITPVLLERGGLAFDHKRMPRPLFWFFSITGFVPTASMALTVVGGQRWRNQIRQRPGWRYFHGAMGLVAYFSWWLACSPVFLMAIIGEDRALELVKKSGLLEAMRKPS